MRSRSNSVAKSNTIWWTHPVAIMLMTAGVLSFCAFLIPEGTYREEWRTPKYFDATSLIASLCCVAGFCTAAWAASAVGGRKPANEASRWEDSLPWRVFLRLFDVTIILTLAGYLIWAAAAISRGATLGLAIDVLSGTKGAAALMKDVYLVTISGVTTMTQFGICSVVLGCLLLTRYPARRIAIPLSLVGALAVLRAFLNSERLALIELSVPACVLLLQLKAPAWATTRYRRAALRLAPVAGAGFVFGAFSLFEFFRSWVTYYADRGDSFLAFAASRLTGYYVTALNNGAFLVSRLSPLGAPYFSLNFLWKMPVFKDAVASTFPGVALNADGAYMSVLSRGANPEYNNGGGLLLPMVDFGFLGAVAFWSLVGVAAGALYSSFRQYKPTGLLLYPVLVTGLTETPRILYCADGRVFPAWVLLGTCALLCALIAHRYGPASLPNPVTGGIR